MVVGGGSGGHSSLCDETCFLRLFLFFIFKTYIVLGG